MVCKLPGPGASTFSVRRVDPEVASGGSMNTRHLIRHVLAGLILGIPFLLGAAIWAGGGLAAFEKTPPAYAATRSSPIAITHSDDYVWSVNPDNDSVSVFDVAEDHHAKLAEIEVGKEPW